jgi:hypothetical protein
LAFFILSKPQKTWNQRVPTFYSNACSTDYKIRRITILNLNAKPEDITNFYTETFDNFEPIDQPTL